MDSRAPLILIAPQTQEAPAESGGLRSQLSRSYAAAVLAAGGVPIIASCLPDATYVSEVVGRCDGVLLTGGDDVSPDLYEPQMDASLRSTICMDGPDRDRFEVLVVEEVLRRQLPLMGICRGMQLVNVALGGTLYADIPTQVPSAIQHSRGDAKDQVVHEVEIFPETLLHEVVQVSRLGVNSTHHQSVRTLAKVLRPNAVSRDGVVEGFELANGHVGLLPYLMAVQFHPERLWDRHPKHLDLFRSLTTACRRNRQ